MRQNWHCRHIESPDHVIFFTSGHLYPAHLSTIKARVDQRVAKRPASITCLVASGDREDALPRRHALSVQGQSAIQAMAAADPASALLDRLHAGPASRCWSYYQPDDYWHVPPSAPEGEWVEHFDIRVIAESGRGRRRTCPASGRVAIIGEADAALPGFEPNNPKVAARLPALPSRVQDAVRTGADAPRPAQGRARPRRGARTPSSAARRRPADQRRLPRRRRAYRLRRALQQHRRAERERRHPALPVQAVRRAGRAPLAADRRRRGSRRLRLRHHPHLGQRRRRLRRPGQRGGSRAAGAVRQGPRRHRLPRPAPGVPPAPGRRAQGAGHRRHGSRARCSRPA